MRKKSLKPLFTKPSKQSKHQRSEFMRERIYGTVTLMAVNIGLIISGNPSIQHAFITIITTTIGLWLASMFAAVMAHRLVHDANMPRRDLIHQLTIHRGLLLAALPAMIMLSLAALDVIELRTALIADVSLGLVGLTVAILRSAKTATNSLQTATISVGVQAVVALLIIFVKLGAK